MIEASIVCDSISSQGKRITTFKLRYPKFIHGEFMTHRVISRNASSSRAIPTAKLIEEVRSDSLRAAPVFWGKNQSGMQAAEELDNTDHKYVNPYEPYSGPFLTAMDRALVTWDQAARHAADFATEMLEVGTHKQIVNRLLEPFSHINVVATATEWDNFFGLRLHKDAQPEMRALAEAMWTARATSTPRPCNPTDNWHLPFFEPEDWSHLHDSKVVDIDKFMMDETGIAGSYAKDLAIKVSVARCARVSYETFETGKRSTVEEDLKLYDRLTAGLRDPTQPLHASPMEHQATPDSENKWSETYEDGSRQEKCPECSAEESRWAYPEEHGNFVGWRQYRKMLPNEAVAPLPEGYTP